MTRLVNPWIICLGTAAEPGHVYLRRSDDGATSWTHDGNDALGFSTKSAVERFGRDRLASDFHTVESGRDD